MLLSKLKTSKTKLFQFIRLTFKIYLLKLFGFFIDLFLILKFIKKCYLNKLNKMNN